MKLEVGMYIRTIGDVYEPSKIGKIKEVDIVSFKEVCYRIDSCGKHILIPKSFIKKSSFNLIDLIEVGDIAKMVVLSGNLGIKKGTPITNEVKDTTYLQKLVDDKDIEIKAILTHEQYEANCYKVE